MSHVYAGLSNTAASDAEAPQRPAGSGRLDLLRADPLRLLEVTVPKALGLAEQLGLYAYDAYIIEAARAQRVPLLALDGRLRTAAAELGLEVWEVTA